MPNRHPLDIALDAVVKYALTAPDQVADALMYRGRSPFAADLTDQELEDYYYERWFNPDGTDNAEFQDLVQRTRGVAGHLKIMTRMLERKLAEGAPGLPEREPIDEYQDEYREVA